MKALVLLLLIAAGVFAWVRREPAANAGETVSAPGTRPSEQLNTSAPEGVVDLSDIQGRLLRCEVNAKRGGHVQVRREADGRVFLLKLDTLDEPSRRRLANVADFKTRELEATAFDAAKTTLKVELLSVPALCTFRCPLNGRMLTSTKGYELENFREFLRKEGIGYRDVPLNIQPDRDGAYSLPPDVPDVPCMRIGAVHIERQDSQAIRTALVAAYLGDS